MCCYYQVRQWHADYDQKTPPTSTSERSGSEEREIKFNRSYIKQKLDTGLSKLWMVSQSTVCNQSIWTYGVLL